MPGDIDDIVHAPGDLDVAFIIPVTIVDCVSLLVHGVEGHQEVKICTLLSALHIGMAVNVSACFPSKLMIKMNVPTF